MTNIKVDFLHWDIETLTHAYQTKQLSPVDVMKVMLERISHDELNAFITVTADDAIAEAKQAEDEINAGISKGPLHGVPIAIKDIIFTEGVRTTMGSDIYSDYIPTYDATAVQKLKEAGAIIVGKLNTQQFAYGATGDRSHVGPVKNPHNKEKMSGGSSSGSVAAVASSLCYGALGTDTGGSIRIPSSFGGIVGMKPTFGRVSKYGAYPLCWSMDHIGPMTRTVKDNALLLNVLSGYDERDEYSIEREPEDFTRFLTRGIEGSVIGVLDFKNDPNINEQVRQQTLQAVETFRSLGAEIKYVEIPEMADIMAAFRTILRSEAYAVHEERLSTSDQYDDEVKERLLTGQSVSIREYVEAGQVKQAAIRKYHKIFEEVDVLITPTVPILPANIGQREIDIDGRAVHINLLLNYFTGALNITGLPSMSIPNGFSDCKLPIGLQIIGKEFDEANMYRFAYAFEQSNK
ncbi:amidase [bacterium LRH843]|nr:amidase [bacterium LRH843]